MSRLPDITPAEWGLFTALFGERATVEAKRQYMRRQRHARRAMRVRMALSLLAFLVCAALVVGAAYGFILLMWAAFGADPAPVTDVQLPTL